MDIKKAIKKHGWTISAMADRLGVSQPSLSQNINGNPTLSRLQEIADVLNISVSELLEEENERTHLVCPHCGKSIKVIIQ